MEHGCGKPEYPGDENISRLRLHFPTDIQIRCTLPQIAQCFSGTCHRADILRDSQPGHSDLRATGMTLGFNTDTGCHYNSTSQLTVQTI